MSQAYQNLDVVGQRHATDPHAMLLADLADFVTRHRSCGQLIGDATRADAGGLHATRHLLLRVTFLR
jgi:hypothetical protein